MKYGYKTSVWKRLILSSSLQKNYNGIENPRALSIDQISVTDLTNVVETLFISKEFLVF